jgi:hypothetical protein
MNRKGLIWAGTVAVICAAAIATLITWPPTDSITWRLLSPPSWWQFEWLAGLGFWISALPSFVIYKFDAFFAVNESLRYPIASLLVLVEVLLFCLCAYGLVVLSDANADCYG